VEFVMSAPHTHGTSLYRQLGAASTSVDADALVSALARQLETAPDRPALRRRAIEAWLPLAQHLTRRYTGRGEPEDDLLQVAVEGLIKAVDRYDPDVSDGFAPFAIPTVLGEMKRHFRDRTWTIRPPRRLQERWADITKAKNELANRLGRAPTVADVAEHLGVSEEDVVEGLEGGQAYRATSFSAPAGPTGEAEFGDTLGDLDRGYASVENRMALQVAWKNLSERHQTVLGLLFRDELSQAEIGTRIGVSQMHVSRLVAAAVGALRTEILGAEVGPARIARTRKAVAA
jgi:RNA polymerase sigma-B factor